MSEDEAPPAPVSLIILKDTKVTWREVTVFPSLHNQSLFRNNDSVTLFYGFWGGFDMSRK